MGVLLPGSDTIRLYSRKEWGARPPRPLNDQPRAPREAFLHHTAGASGHKSLEAQKKEMRNIQNFHMDGRGWSDVAYHFLVFQPFGNVPYARVFEGRDWHKIPAAQEGHNTGTLAVCVVGDFTRVELKRNTRHAIAALLKGHQAGRALVTLGAHNDVSGTSCPGANAEKWIPRVANSAGLKVYGR